jgi:hypothetical protein
MSSLAEGTTSGPGSGTEDATSSGEAPTTGSTTTDPVTSDPATSDPATTDPVTSNPATGEPGELNCDAYCDTYAVACVDFSEYDNRDACLQQCNQWPIGIANETAGDSLGCRTYHVSVAATTDPDLHCPHAGPSGAGMCVDPDAPTCNAYCAAYAIGCKDFPVYLDEAACLAQCSEWYPGTEDQTQGDSIACRLYHAGVAFIDPQTHCPHAGPGGANVCVAQ